MKKILLFFIIVSPLATFSQSYIRDWATYFGDSSLYITGTIESKGYIYMVGKTTNSAHTQTMATSGVAQSSFGGGISDGFIAKMDTNGQPVWFTYYGGAGEDEIFDIVADDDALYIVGKTNSPNLATANTHQATVNGDFDGFIASFDENGQKLWHTYMGGEALDEANGLVQKDNNLYIYGRTQSLTDIATTGTFQETIYPNSYGTYFSNFIAGFTKNGQRNWSTYYGHIPPEENSSTHMTGIAINNSGIYVTGWDPDTGDNIYYGTPGSFLPTKPVAPTGLGLSIYLSKFSFTGERIWGTYYSGYNSAMHPITTTSTYGEAINYRNITANQYGVFFGGRTLGNNGISTPNSFQPQKTGASAPFIVNFSDGGERIWGSYLGNYITNPDYGGEPFSTNHALSLSSDLSGALYIMGVTRDTKDIATENSYQPLKHHFQDCFVAKISADGTEKLYGTYYGSNNNDVGAVGMPLSSGNGFYLVGATASQVLISSSGSYQENFIPGGEFNKNTFVVKFVEGSLVVDKKNLTNFSIYPNPAETSFTVKGAFNDGLTISIFDLLGKKVSVKTINNLEETINISHLNQGVYLVKIEDTETRNMQTVKLVKS